jgi:hypothetical protein
MKAQGERRYSSYSFMTSALDGVSGQRHESSALYTQGRAPGTHWAGGWLGLRSGLDTEARRKILCLFLGSNPGHPAYSQTLYWLSYPGCYVVNRDQEFSACRWVYVITTTYQVTQMQPETDSKNKEENNAERTQVFKSSCLYCCDKGCFKIMILISQCSLHPPPS